MSSRKGLYLKEIEERSPLDIIMTSIQTKGGESKLTGGRRKAMTSEEIDKEKKQLHAIPKKTRGNVRIEVNENKQQETRQIMLHTSNVFSNITFTILRETTQFCDEKLIEIVKKMEQVRVYCIINCDKLRTEENLILCTVVFNTIQYDISGTFQIDTSLNHTIIR